MPFQLRHSLLASFNANTGWAD